MEAEDCLPPSSPLGEAPASCVNENANSGTSAARIHLFEPTPQTASSPVTFRAEIHWMTVAVGKGPAGWPWGSRMYQSLMPRRRMLLQRAENHLFPA